MAVGRGVRDRIAAQSAMAAVVHEQSFAVRRSLLGRIFGVSPLAPAARASYRDALGELIVGDQLEHLGQRWDVLHDIPLGASTLDHLLIGPSGVFAVRAAHVGERDVVIDGELLAAGEPTDHVSAVARQANLASEHLSDAAGESIRVRPLLVVVGPRRLVVKRPASVVRVVDSADLERFLTKAPQVLTGDEVANISDLADLESTWSAPHSKALDAQSLHRSFAAVRTEVRGALRTRILWATSAFAGAFVVLWLLVARAAALVIGS